MFRKMNSIFLAAVAGLLALCPAVYGQEEYPAVIQGDDPVAYYRFEEAIDAVVLEDAMDTHHSLQVTDITFEEEGIIGQAGLFNGLTSIAELDLQLDPAGGDFSIEIITKPLQVRQSNVFVSQQDGTGLGRSNLTLSTAGGSFGTFIGGVTSSSNVIPDTTSWYHVIMTYNTSMAGIGDTISFYVNGELTGTGTAIAESADGNWILGSHKSMGSAWINGLIDELSVYDYALDDPDGDDDPVDSKVESHYDATGGIETVCETVNVNCTFLEDFSLYMEITTTSPDCECTHVEIAIDGTPEDTIELPDTGIVELFFESDRFEPASEHTLTVTCDPEGLTGSCMFTVPEDPCADLGVSCTATDDGSLLVQVELPDLICACETIAVTVDGTLASTEPFPGDGLVELALPQDCEAGSLHEVMVACTEEGSSGTCVFRCPGGEDDYVNAVMADGPVAYYRFEEDENALEVFDSSDNDHLSVLVSNVTLGAPGILGKAAQFNGDGYIELDLQMNPADPEGDGIGVGLGDFSIEAFVSSSAVQLSTVMAAQQDGTGLGRSNYILVANTGSFGSYIGGATTGSSVTPELDTWYHYVLTYDGTVGVESIRIYVDGELAGSNAVSRTAESADGNWIIGAHKNLGMQFFQGSLDELAFYDFRLDDPDGDDDTADSRVAVHYEAAVKPIPGCDTMTLACSVVDDKIRAEITLAPDGCNCSEVDLFVDDVPFASEMVPASGILELDLPANCAAGDHTLAVVCSANGLSQTCTFTCAGGGEGFFKRGDVNDDDKIDLADAISLLTYLFVNKNDPGISCLDAADGNDDGKLNLADAIRVLSFLFGEDDEMPAPFPGCGADPTDDDPLVGCEYTHCQ